ncbi:MAG: hypothetical protein ACRC20_09210 [Segniliparus sp.]|uniref:hypothetical protein n=1 Tax=Segniliparus sp. TaxID=2804064 RepID=UPI003F2C23C5
MSDGTWESRRKRLHEQKTVAAGQPQEPRWRRKIRTALTGLSEGPWRDLGYVRLDPPDWESGHGRLAAEDRLKPDDDKPSR